MFTLMTATVYILVASCLILIICFNAKNLIHYSQLKHLKL